MNPEHRAILVIDSDQSWLGFCKNTLQKNGYSVYAMSEVKDIQKTFPALAHIEFKLILMDERILKSSDEITKELGDLKEQILTSTIVLFATGMTPQKLRGMFKLGVFDCVNKPFNESSLIALIEQLWADYRLRRIKPKREAKTPNSVLIVEDDPDWRSSLTRYLPASIKNIEAATDYQTAMDKLQNHTYDLVVFDLSLKDIDEANFDGLDLIRTLRSQDRQHGVSTPVIVVSAYGTPDQIRETFKVYNIDYYFDKKYLSPTKYKESVMAALR